MGQRVRPGESGGPDGAGNPPGGLSRARPGPHGLSTPTREQLRRHLVDTLIAGDVATTRQNNLRHYRRLASGRTYDRFGLDLERSWTYEEIFALMVTKVGIDPDPAHYYGDDTIDPDLTIDALEAAADRIRRAAEQREAVLLATGHPTGLLPVYLAVGRALRRRGCRILTPAAGWSYEAEGRHGPETRHIRYIEGVATLSGGGALHHTHDAHPMRAILKELSASGDAWPNLAIADHGWAGAAGQAGVSTVGFADCNDPALFVGEAEDKLAVVVPLDDNVLPHHYAPLTGYLLARSGLID